VTKNSLKSYMGAYRVLVSLPDFKSGVSRHKREWWVRFPHAPASTLRYATRTEVHQKQRGFKITYKGQRSVAKITAKASLNWLDNK
jgi:hypothetical protein